MTVKTAILADMKRKAANEKVAENPKIAAFKRMQSFARSVRRAGIADEAEAGLEVERFIESKLAQIEPVSVPTRELQTA